MAQPSQGFREEGGDAAPLFGTWGKAYITVIAAFVFDVALFYAFSHYFS